eukprot:1534757-Pleurochrysis_carterae.AAC.1
MTFPDIADLVRHCSQSCLLHFCITAKYAHAGTPWTVHGIAGKNYRPCYWVEALGDIQLIASVNHA